MNARTTVACLTLACFALVLLASGAFGDASSPAGAPGEAQRKVTSRVVGGETLLLIEPRVVAESEGPKSPAELSERIQALEKENVVLREDLGKARLDVRTSLAEADARRAKEAAEFQKRIDDLNAQLAAERERQGRKNKDLWLAVGVLALGIIAAN
ncbi:MAG: hypothetical protein MUQ26_00365 [Armatimonadetes bacterium]|nr:hypothetical protein [Armatimonadota bacterium]